MPMPGKFDEIFLTVFSQKTQIASLEKELVATRREALVRVAWALCPFAPHILKPQMRIQCMRNTCIGFVQLDSHLEKLHENRKLFEDDDDDEIEIGYEIDEYGKLLFFHMVFCVYCALRWGVKFAYALSVCL